MTILEKHIVKGIRGGNVTQVSSICPWLQNQSFTENFSYDSTDQLVSANEAQSYQLAVNYGNWGKIMQYDIAQTDMLSNATETHSRSYSYPTANYIDAQTSFAPIMQAGDEHVFLSYGINGSLRQREVQTPNPYNEYFLFNSQNNLKAYSDDVMSFAYYGYNTANTRTYKLSLYNTNLWINGQQQPLHLQWQNAMFYPNTYLNFDAFGNYTKHYYNGTERVASRLGDNNTTIAIDNMLENRKLLLEEQVRNDIQELISETPQVDLPPMLDILNLQPTGTPNDIYYYHPNHLGSTSFVTDNNTTITQGFLYAPFGEITTEYNINFGNNVIPKYSFNAKELDEETGMYYYEARYYAPPTFVSRDVLFEKYFWMSPYAYCANNPVKYVDPDGKEVRILYNKETKKIYVVDLDHYQKGLPVKYVSAKDYQLGGIRDKEGNLTHNQVLVINNVFSGGQVENGKIVRDASDSRQKAIPNATYDIVDNNADTRHEGWFRLDRQDNNRYNDKDDVTGRDGYRFHLGGLSWGCVTVDKTQDDAQDSWDVLTSILNSTSTTTISEKRGRQWLNPFSTLTKYGIMVVKGIDNIPYKPKEEE